ncbi:MAG: cobalamin-dependent protein [Deltaproteobacteria bacterium]|uniref:Cobalamin-dependent protein n=1 Tax=Candidatus Zymogenus saltonus TaxID=2844893 RepID=A0A9D8KDX9_9DELT|nr:cobalamin-dependent protein [Candidatus Zymogenus saltonus]
MRTLIVSANLEVTPDPVYPIGAAYVAAAVREAGHEVDILDVVFADDMAKAVGEKIASFNPEVVGVSIRNIDNVAYPLYLSYIDETKEIVDTIRSSFSGPLVLGGSGFTMMPIDMLEYVGETTGIVGEGEDAMVRFLTALSGDGELSYVSGLIVTENGKVKINNPPRIIEDFDRVPIPADDLCDNAAYLKWGGMGSVQTKRGCPIGCIYCTYPVVEGKAMRLRDPAAVVDEMERSLDRWGVDTYFIVDSVFNNPPEHARQIAREIVRRGLTLRLSAYFSPAFIDEGLLEDLARAGVTGVDLGADSLADPILKKLGKNFKRRDVVEAVRAAKSVGIMTCLNIIFGAPGETKDTMRETVDLLDELQPTANHAMVGIRIFPGTGLQRLAIKEGMQEAKNINLSPIFYIAPAVVEEAVEFVHECAVSRPYWIVPGQMVMAGQDFSGMLKPQRYDSGLGAPFRMQGIKGPLWEMMGKPPEGE